MRHVMLSLIPIIIVTIPPARAHADQCAINNANVVEAARALVTPGKRVRNFCEPCRGGNLGTPYTVHDVDARDGRLVVNGDEVDLAYLFVETRPDVFENVGLATGCRATGVSGKIVKDVASRAPSAQRQPLSPLTGQTRIAKPDDIAGTWAVRATPRISTCTAHVAHGDQTWIITVASGKLSVITDAGKAFSGPLATLQQGVTTHLLSSPTHPNIAGLKLGQLLRDRLWGSLVVAQATGDLRDPICVMSLELWGKRQP